MTRKNKKLNLNPRMWVPYPQIFSTETNKRKNWVRQNRMKFPDPKAWVYVNEKNILEHLCHKVRK